MRSHWTFRLLSTSLAAGQVFLGLPTPARAASSKELAKEEQQPAPPQPEVKVNRTRPNVAPPPMFPTFSAQPTVEEISRARVFDEPLIPMMVAPSPQENRALAQAILSYLKGGGGENLGALEVFLEGHSTTPWRASLLTGMGVVYRRTGYFSRAVRAWQEAWDISKRAQDPRQRILANRALGELAELNARLGRFEELRALFQEIEGREIGGSAEQKLNAARQGLFMMEDRPTEAFVCGPMALDRILAYKKANYIRDPKILAVRGTTKGTSLLQIRNLSVDLNHPMQMAKRESADAPILVPAMIHWKAGHFAAIVDQAPGRLLIHDPTFGEELWISRRAFDDENSGYFLVESGPLPQGWHNVTDEEGANVWGKGPTNISNPQGMGCGAHGSGGNGGGCQGEKCPGGLAVYRFHTMLVNLNVTDKPVGYSAPRGPSVYFAVTYNHREVFQPDIPYYSNLGPKWTHNWLSWIEDDPAQPAQPVNLYLRSGGQETYADYNSGTQSYGYNRRSRAFVVRASSSPLRYERRMPDGSMEVFEQVDGASTFPRKVFLTRIQDPQGNVLTFTYDSSLRLTAVTDAIGQVTTFSYELTADPLKITKVTDPFGRFARFEYGAGKLVKVTDVVGLDSQFEYGSGDFMTALVTPYGRTTFERFEQGRRFWLQATDPLGAKERLEYVNASTDAISDEEAIAVIPYYLPPELIPPGFDPGFYANGIYRNTFFWDKRASALYPGQYSKAKLIHWLHGINATETVDFIENEKNPLEATRTFYKYPGQITIQNFGTHPKPSAVGKVMDDGSAQIWQYEYESQTGKVTRETDPLGRAVTYTYAPNGIDLLEARQVNGESTDRLWTATYNNQHKPLTLTDAAGQTTTFTYNTAGQVLTVLTPPHGELTQAQRTTTYSYDTNGYLQSVTGPATGATTSYTYDGYSRVRTVTDSDSYTLTNDYDALDRQTKVTYPDGTYEETVYNRLDAEKRRDRLGRWSETFYDALRRPVATRDPLGRTTTQQWCNCGSLDKVIDANNNATTWERDLQGRVTREVRADSSAWEYTYENTTSRLKQRKDPKNQLTNYSYLLDNNLQQVSYTNAVVTTPNVSFTYDPVYNRLATMTDGTGTTTYSYNPITTSPPLGAGELASVDGPLANDTVSYTYDEVGRVASRGLSGFVSSFSYDALGRLSTQGSPVGNFVPSYDGTTFRPLTLSYPNGQTTQYTYFPNSGDHRLQQIKHLAPGGPTISKYDYTYSLTGNLATWSQQVGANPAKLYTLGYDAGDQLTTASVSGPSPLPVPSRFAYSFDPAGNRTAEQLDDTVTGASHDNRNRLTSHQPGGALFFRGTLNEPATVSIQGKSGQVAADNRFAGPAQVPSGTSNVVVAATDPSGNTRTNTYQVTEAGSTTTYTYDAAGNLTGDGTRTFEYDAEHRLTAVKQEAATLASFVHDGNGRRAQKTAGGVTTTYVYDGDGVIEERLSTGGTLKYVRGPRIDQHWAMRDGGGVVTYFLADHLGSVVQTTDASGAVTLTRDYDPYGNPLSGASQSGYAFTGRDWDAETGLLYMRSRYYDPKPGRFLSEDPIGLENLYGYVANRPTIGTDPYGLIDPFTLCFRYGICPPPGGPSATVIPPPPKPRPTPTPINCSGGPNAAMSARWVPPPPPQCIGPSLCPCGYVAVPDAASAGLCFIAGGNVPTIGTAASGQGTPPSGMGGAAGRRTGTAGPPNTGGTAPEVPNPGAAAGAGIAFITTNASFCGKVGIKCVPK
jgi:RHS repeat-associated protein